MKPNVMYVMRSIFKLILEEIGKKELNMWNDDEVGPLDKTDSSGRWYLPFV